MRLRLPIPPAQLTAAIVVRGYRASLPARYRYCRANACARARYGDAHACISGGHFSQSAGGLLPIIFIELGFVVFGEFSIETRRIDGPLIGAFSFAAAS
ncbi:MULTISPECIES: hypothetical protein [Burkholderia]|uniref:hypothetical protein n=1 Tax=Burkholderia TaxID=32008 RepID=UPI0011AEE39F|nr:MULTISPECIES: hypothetical protein [unclassified Burkholderia]